jgi:hypothetical protein
VINRVHCRATDLWALAHVSCAPGLADCHVLVVKVRDLTHGCHAEKWDETHLARRHADRGEGALFGDELRCGSGGADHLATLPWNELDVVDRCTERHATERQGVSDLRFSVWARDHVVADR